MPRSCRSHAGQPTRRIACNCRGTPKPLLEEMISEIFQSRLHPPIVFARDENKAVGRDDFAGQSFEGFWSFAFAILLVHPIEYGEVYLLGIDQFDVFASATQALDDKAREPNA